MMPLSVREARTRFVGVLALVAVAYLHVLDISHKVEEGIWYMVFLFATLIVGCAVLAATLVRADTSAVRFVWVGAAALAAGALFGYFVSRAIPMPGMADHQGDWVNTIGVLAGLCELGLIYLAGFALRDRVRRLARSGGRRGTRVAVPAIGLAGLLLQPAFALAHAGEEDDAGSEGAAASQPAGGDPMGAQGGMHPADPFLGTAELLIILLVALGFVAWAGSALSVRASATSRRRRVESPLRRPEPSARAVRDPARAPLSRRPASASGAAGSRW